jgi:hypothetical protein
LLYELRKEGLLGWCKCVSRHVQTFSLFLSVPSTAQTYFAFLSVQACVRNTKAAVLHAAGFALIGSTDGGGRSRSAKKTPGQAHHNLNRLGLPLSGWRGPLDAGTIAARSGSAARSQRYGRVPQQRRICDC